MNFRELPEKFQSSLRRFMSGRSGMDALNLALLCLGLALSFVSLFTRNIVFMALYYAALILCIYRILSKKTYERQRENQRFMVLFEKVKTPIKQGFVRFQNRKLYRYFTCPECKSKIRVPRGRGGVTITCGRCGHQFVKNA